MSRAPSVVYIDIARVRKLIFSAVLVHILYVDTLIIILETCIADSCISNLSLTYLRPLLHASLFTAVKVFATADRVVHALVVGIALKAYRQDWRAEIPLDAVALGLFTEVAWCAVGSRLARITSVSSSTDLVFAYFRLALEISLARLPWQHVFKKYLFLPTD